MNSNCKDIAPYYQRNLDSIRVSALYAHQKYGRAAYVSKFSENKSLSNYYFISLFKMNLKRLARRALCQEIRKTSLRLVSMESSLCDLLQDKKICNILVSERSQDEFDEMVSSINSSAETKSQHEQFARKLRNYYDKKCNYKSL